MTREHDTNINNRRKIEPVGYEDVMAFVDYADQPGELKSIRMPIYEIPSHCKTLRKKRVDMRYTLKRAADAFGMSPSELSGIEHGRLECSAIEVDGMITALVVDQHNGWKP